MYIVNILIILPIKSAKSDAIIGLFWSTGMCKTNSQLGRIDFSRPRDKYFPK